MTCHFLLPDEKRVRWNPYCSFIFVEGVFNLLFPNLDKQITLEVTNEKFFRILYLVASSCAQGIELCLLFSSMKSEFDSEELAFRFFRSLLQMGILIDELTLNPEIYRFEEDFRQFFSIKDSVVHADYSANTIAQYDNDLMQSFRQDEQSPSIYKEFISQDVINLTHPAVSTACTGVSRLSHLLFYCFGKLREFPMLSLKSLLKCVPSLGARHGLEAYIANFEDNNILPKGIFHYAVRNHQLIKIADLKNVKKASMLLCITVIFERYQWRYRHSWNYKDIFFDLGHVMGQLKAIAEEFRVCCKEIPISESGSFVSQIEIPLFEEGIACFEISNL